MLVFSLTERPAKATRDHADIARCTWNGMAFEAVRSRGSAIAALCRTLVAAGYPDQPWQVPGRLSGPSIHRMAGLTLEERDNGGMVWRPYRPPPVGVLREDGR